MLKNVYGILDVKAGFYAPPFFMDSHGLAIREFTGIVRDARTVVSKYPEDFHLRCLGTFDTVSGELKSLPAPIALGSGLDYVDVNGLRQDPLPLEQGKEVGR